MRKEILEASGMDETLAECILEKDKGLRKLVEEKDSLFKKMWSKDVRFGSFEFWEMLIRRRFLSIDVEQEIRSLNSMCNAYEEVVTLSRAKKSFKKDWQDIMSRLDNVRIEDVVAMYTEVKNPRYLVKCPIHADSTPSLKIYPDTNSFYCFGCCRGGKPVNLVMYVENVSFKVAVLKLILF